MIPAERDPVGRSDRPLTITIDGVAVNGVHGQTLASVLLAADRSHWRTGPNGGRRGVFCGIGICFDCAATVNGIPDIRLCRRPARDGDVIATQTREIAAESGAIEPRAGTAITQPDMSAIAVTADVAAAQSNSVTAQLGSTEGER
ncbi:(2Fe-2S)-binding protein [Nocardia sp. NPDC127526]|uniref:(2Fe-2S)-binding protein n=1 Tax=Nocardia sp. NPDC127526 TaxID=3345393 RepID=UPI00363C6399